MHERMLRVLGGTLVAVVLALGSAGLYAEELAKSVKVESHRRSLSEVEATSTQRILSPATQSVPPGMTNLRELPTGTKFTNLRTGGSDLDGAVAGAVTSKLVYSNALGRVIIPLPQGFTVADDVAFERDVLCKSEPFAV